jgi:hypothetical protein
MKINEELLKKTRKYLEDISSHKELLDLVVSFRMLSGVTMDLLCKCNDKIAKNGLDEKEVYNKGHLKSEYDVIVTKENYKMEINEELVKIMRECLEKISTWEKLTVLQFTTVHLYHAICSTLGEFNDKIAKNGLDEKEVFNNLHHVELFDNILNKILIRRYPDFARQQRNTKK